MYLTAIKYLAPVVLFAAYTWGAVSYGVKQEKTRWENEAFKAVISAHESAGKFTAGLLSDNKETEDDAIAKNDELDNTVRNAISLREQLDALQKRHSDDRARNAEYSKTAQNTIRVLSRLLKESDSLAGVYAENADRNRIAGLACEKYAGDLVKRLKSN